MKCDKRDVLGIATRTRGTFLLLSEQVVLFGRRGAAQLKPLSQNSWLCRTVLLNCAQNVVGCKSTEAAAALQGGPVLTLGLLLAVALAETIVSIVDGTGSRRSVRLGRFLIDGPKHLILLIGAAGGSRWEHPRRA